MRNLFLPFAVLAGVLGAVVAGVLVYQWLFVPPFLCGTVTRTPTEVIARVQAETAAAEDAYQPKSPSRIDDLTADAAATLRSLPGVERVEVTVAVEQPRLRIIHVLDHHHVARDLFDIEMRQRNKWFSEEDRQRWYGWHLSDVEVVQLQQLAMLRALAKHHGLKRVYQEALTQEGFAEFLDLRQNILDLQLVGKEDEVKDVLLVLGAAARVRGVEVLPLDDARLHEAAKPIKDGKVQFDDEKVRRRREAMVKNVVDGGGGVIVLGASHDLSEQVRQVPGCEYVRVWVKHLPK